MKKPEHDSDGASAPPAPAPGLRSASVASRPAAEHLDALLEFVAALAHRALVHAWSSGRLGMEDYDRWPDEHKVRALSGRPFLYDDEELADLDARLNGRMRHAAQIAHRYHQQGIRLPFPTIAREFGLTYDEARVLLTVGATYVSGGIRCLCANLADDSSRLIPDRHLLHELSGDYGSRARQVVDAALRPSAPLIRDGLVRMEGPFDHLSVDDIILDRIRGFDATELLGPLSQVHEAVDANAFTFLDDFERSALAALWRPDRYDAPVRIVLRAAPSSERLAACASLAARAGKRLAAIDAATAMSRSPVELQNELRRIRLAGGLPCVDNVESLPGSSDAACSFDALLDRMERHPGPISLCISPEPPLPDRTGWTVIESRIRWR